MAGFEPSTEAHGFPRINLVRGDIVETPGCNPVRCNRWWAAVEWRMPSRAQEVLRDALALPLDERADVAAELLASLDEAAVEQPGDVEAAWATEIERRARRALADESGGVPWDDVRRRADAELRQR